MHTTLPSSDPAMLHKGLSMIHAMRLSAIAARRNTALSKSNRDFFREQEAALAEVERFALFHLHDRGVGC